MHAGLVLLAATVLIAAGCSSKQHRAGAATPPGSLASILSRPGPDVALIPGNSDFAPGDVRFSFLLVRNDASVVVRPLTRVWLARGLKDKPFAVAEARLQPVGIPGQSEAAVGDVTSIYVVRLRIPRPGRYTVLAEPVGGRAIQGVYDLEVKPRPQSLSVGAAAPVSSTPKLGTAPIRVLTTRTPPDRALLRYSVADALRARAPFVVVFATPKFCTSRTCGPVVDVVDYVRRHSQPGIRFIHVEVFRRNNPQLGYNRWLGEWHLKTEPWIFLVGRDGRIKAKFEGSVAAAELGAAVRRHLG